MKSLKKLVAGVLLAGVIAAPLAAQAYTYNIYGRAGEVIAHIWNGDGGLYACANRTGSQSNKDTGYYWAKSRCSTRYGYGEVGAYYRYVSSRWVNTI